MDFYFINKFENEYDWDNVCPELKTLLKVALRNVLRQIKELLKSALTSDINSRELFMKGIDYSYYYEEVE